MTWGKLASVYAKARSPNPGDIVRLPDGSERLVTKVTGFAIHWRRPSDNETRRTPRPDWAKRAVFDGWIVEGRQKDLGL